MSNSKSALAVKPHLAILGAGPTGLEAALAAAEHGYPFTLYEASVEVAGHVASWGHVRLFTPWSMNVSPRARQALEAAGSPAPDGDACPTGAEMVEQLFRPLAELPALRDNLRYGVRVRNVARRGLLKHEEISSATRAGRPFRLLLQVTEGPDAGHSFTEEADLVLDCTGNAIPNPLGDGGIPAPGEDALKGAATHTIPDLERNAAPWTGRTILLVGAGHSAQTALASLVELARKHAGTRIVWVLRGAGPRPVAEDPLPERARLTGFAAELLNAPPDFLDVRHGVVIDRFETQTDGGEMSRIAVVLRRDGADGSAAEETVEVDRILGLTGRLGDHQLYRQLQVHECYATSGPMKLAAALLGQDAAAGDGGGGDCLAQASQGADTLKNPEPGFFILGIKSYGRRNDFLLRVGWQQVDEVFSLLP